MHKSVIEELKRIIKDSEIMQEDDATWPSPDRVGRQVSKPKDTNFCTNYKVASAVMRPKFVYL